MAQENLYEEFHKKWSKVVAKAWADEGFKKRLLSNPEQVLKENGCEALAGHTFKVYENRENMIHLVIPEKPQGNLSEEELKKIAAGGFCPIAR